MLRTISHLRKASASIEDVILNNFEINSTKFVYLLAVQGNAYTEFPVSSRLRWSANGQCGKLLGQRFMSLVLTSLEDYIMRDFIVLCILNRILLA
jgi:hypothetical protein